MPDGIFSRHWDVVSAASPEAWAPRAAAWLDSCRNEHVQCAMSHSPGAGNGGGFQPTRLIDVRDPMRPRLVTTANFESGEIQPYATLSYVWGPGQSYVLLSDSVAEMHEQLDLSRLPKTIADAIEVARHLGLDYIWIDALCIIQDSPDDKARELPLMADIYRNGAVSVVAAVAASASEGFLREPESAKFLVQPFDIDLGVADGAPSSLTFGYRDPYKASADPISSRAWTLQERVLAPRLLIFSRTGVMWMCREHFANPSAAPDAGPPYQTSLGFAAGAGADGKPVDDDMMRESWMAIRADYTEMDLTYCSDKLPAISALAAEVARRTGWTYVAGLWLENLFSELHWRCMKAERPSLSLDDGDSSLQLKPPKVREAGYLAPSWSWASIGLGMIVDSEGERLDREAFHFRIVRCEVDHAGFQYGPVTGGFLEVEGRLVELDWQSRDEPDWYGTDILLVDPLGKGPEGKPLFLGDGTLDPLDEPLSQAEPLVCLSMSKLKFGRQPITPIEGLLLYPKTPESGGNVFRRIGFFRITGVSIFDQAPSRRMRIE